MLESWVYWAAVGCFVWPFWMLGVCVFGYALVGYFARPREGRHE